MANVLGILVHMLGFSANSFGLGYSIIYGADQHGDSGLLTYRGWPGKLKYLTFWCEVLQFLYFSLAVINDVIGSSSSAPGGKQAHQSWLQRKRDSFHATIAFPVAVFVVSTFWVLYAINRELVFPKEMDKYVPVWQNHIIHTFPIVWLLLEKMCVSITYPSRRSGLVKVIAFALLYQIWIIYIALTADQWVYPVLRVLSWGHRMVFFVVLWATFMCMYLLGETVSKLCYIGPNSSTKKTH